MAFREVASFEDLKKDKKVIPHILWDIEPRQLMEPRIIVKDDGSVEKKIIRGYIFYIDKMSEKGPALFLMCHTTMGYAETVAKIDEIPYELIQEALEENKDKEYFGMIPINKNIELWLKKELGIE